VLSQIGLRSIALGFTAAALAAAPALAAPHVDGEFEVKGELGSNNKIAEGPDGNIWATVSNSTNDVARITPSGEVKEFNLRFVEHPTCIARGPDGNMWVTGNEVVVKFAPSAPEDSGSTTEQHIEEVKNPSSIVAGPDGNMWVAASGHLIRISSELSNFKAFPVAGLDPRDIDVAGSVLVIADTGENEAKEHRIVTATAADPPATTDHPIAGGSQGVAGNSSGQIAFSQQLGNPEQIGLITPPNLPQTIDVPATDPFGVALGSDGAFWIAQANTDGVARLTTNGQSTQLGGFAKGLKPLQIASGPGNTLWVTLNEPVENINKVGRISGLEPPTGGGGGGPSSSAAPQTKITKGPKNKVFTKHRRATVKFKFSSATPGVSFECALTKLKKKKGKAQASRFSPCKSPKVYKLKPGSYRFEVRSVLGAVPDKTPAKSSFRVIRRR
jgi:streptogramin lyase